MARYTSLIKLSGMTFPTIQFAGIKRESRNLLLPVVPRGRCCPTVATWPVIVRTAAHQPPRIKTWLMLATAIFAVAAIALGAMLVRAS
jgi:hypothetical protein